MRRKYAVTHTIGAEGIDTVTIHGAGWEGRKFSEWDEEAGVWNITIPVPADEDEEPYIQAIETEGFELNGPLNSEGLTVSGMYTLEEIAEEVSKRLGVAYGVAKEAMDIYLEQMQVIYEREMRHDSISEDDRDFLIEAAKAGYETGAFD